MTLGRPCRRSRNSRTRKLSGPRCGSRNTRPSKTAMPSRPRRWKNPNKPGRHVLLGVSDRRSTFSAEPPGSLIRRCDQILLAPDRECAFPCTTCPIDIARPDCRARALSPFPVQDRKSTRLNSSHSSISYAVFCLKKKRKFKHLRVEHDEFTAV